MTIRILAFILSVLFPTMAPAASGPNEPSGFTTLSDFNFDSRCANGWVCVYPSGQIVQDSTAPISFPNVLQYAWQNHSFTDVSYTYYSFPAGTTQFYIALWWKPSNPFYGWPTVQQQKIMLLEGSHTYFSMFRSAGSGASSVYGLWNHINRPNNNQHIGSGFGQGELLFPNVSGPSVALGQWHLLEWRVKASTTSSSRDGILRWWMDGQMMGNYTNVNTEVRTFQTIMLAPVWDTPVQEYSAFTDTHRFDHVHLSVGSGGGGGVDNPPGPPSAPRITSVTAQ